MLKFKNREAKATAFFLAFLATLTAVYAAYTVWQQQSRFTVIEPLQVSSNLPKNAVVTPGSYSYWVNVTNIGSQPLTAELVYSVVEENVSATITPSSGTSQPVPPSGTVSFTISINVQLEEGKTEGLLTVNWHVQRG